MGWGWETRDTHSLAVRYGEDGKRLGTGARDRNRNLCGAFESQVERERWALDLRGIVWDRMGMERANENGGWVLATAARLVAPRSATSTSRIRSLELDLGENSTYRQTSTSNNNNNNCTILQHRPQCTDPRYLLSVCVPCCACSSTLLFTATYRIRAATMV